MQQVRTIPLREKVQPSWGDLGFSEGGFIIRCECRGEELTLAVYLRSRGSEGCSSPEVMGIFCLVPKYKNWSVQAKYMGFSNLNGVN